MKQLFIFPFKLKFNFFSAAFSLMLDIKNGMLRDEDALACNLNSEGLSTLE